jgi:hypothetical protein
VSVQKVRVETRIKGKSEIPSEVVNGMESFGDCEKWAGRKGGTGRSGSAADVAAEPCRGYATRRVAGYQIRGRQLNRMESCLLAFQLSCCQISQSVS